MPMCPSLPPLFPVEMVTSAAVNWVIGWSTYHFPDEVHLPRGDHVADARDGVKHLPHFVVMESLFADFGHWFVEDASDAAMEKHFKFVKLQFS